MHENFFFLLVSCQTCIPSLEGKDYTNNGQNIRLIFSKLFMTGYVMPIEGLIMGLFLCLFTYFMAAYLIWWRAHEKFRIAMEFLPAANIPLILWRNCWEELSNTRPVQFWNKIGMETPVLEFEEQNSEKDHLPVILLVMSDKRFSDYLRESLSEYFCISVLENPDLLVDTVIDLYPDAIIIDEVVDGISGDELCFRVRSDRTIGMIPLVLLGEFTDIESYSSHALSGANLLEPRTERISKLRVDLRMVVENHLLLREQLKLFLSKDIVLPAVPVRKVRKDADRELLQKVNACLEYRINEHIKKQATQFSYGVNDLCIDMDMEHDDLLAKIREYTDLSIEGYILRYRMRMALYLMLKEKRSPNEASQMLCFYDYSHFGKNFKKVFHVAPSQFTKVITG